jgi:O-acetyl-ADP-ribose deacetylase (regulator of RNase III)
MRKIIDSSPHFLDGRVTVIFGDITLAKVDVLVNAANAWLLPGGGVDGAIHRAAGPELANATKVLGGLKTSHVVITPGFHLKAKYVMHALGPIWNNNETEERLSQDLINTYKNIFQTANEKKFKTIAIPNISTGVYGFPKELAAELVVKTTLAFLKSKTDIQNISFYCFDETNFQLYIKYFQDISLKE